MYWDNCIGAKCNAISYTHYLGHLESIYITKYFRFLVKMALQTDFGTQRAFCNRQTVNDKNIII